MAVALKDFCYYDHERKESVQVRRGDAIDAVIEHHGVDLAKLGRTKYVDLQAEGTPHTPAPVKRRARKQ